MDKNYYDILQVNKNASPEIIEKAYKVLAKKYHPDLQPEENKKQSEEIFKKINEAYEVLSNPEKKQEYDNYLQNKISTNKTSDTYQAPHNNEAEILRKQQEEIEYQKQLQREVEKAMKQAYYDAYIQDLKNRGYKIRYKKTLKEYVKNFIALILTIFFILIILFLIYQIPFVKNYFRTLYNENIAFRYIINFLFNIKKAFIH